jgi:DNA-directed RNA polymerase subunit omega
MAEENNDVTWQTDVDSKYRLVILAARRSKQLQKGAKARTQAGSKKPTKIALEEVEKGLVKYERIGRNTAVEEES